MPVRTEYKFVTMRLKGLASAQSDTGYFNWSDVSDMLTKYGADGWTLGHMTASKLGEDAALYAFVLQRPLGAQPQKRAK